MTSTLKPSKTEIDFDSYSENVVLSATLGDSCDRLIEQLSGLDLAEALPTTVGITSGRLGRYQLIYRVPEPTFRCFERQKIVKSRILYRQAF
jgi:hypothetical protein